MGETPVPWREVALSELQALRDRGLGGGGLLRRLRELVEGQGDDRFCRGFRDFYRKLREFTGAEASTQLGPEEMAWVEKVKDKLWEEWLELCNTENMEPAASGGLPDVPPPGDDPPADVPDSDEATSLVQRSVLLWLPVAAGIPSNIVLAAPPDFLRLAHRKLQALWSAGRDVSGFLVAFRHLFNRRRDRHYIVDCELVMTDFNQYLVQPMPGNLAWHDVEEDLQQMAWWLESELWTERVEDVEEATGWESETVMAMREEQVMPLSERLLWRSGEDGAKKRRVEGPEGATSSSSSAPLESRRVGPLLTNTPGPFADSLRAYLSQSIPQGVWNNVLTEVLGRADHRQQAGFLQYCRDEWTKVTRGATSSATTTCDDIEMDEFASWIENELWESYLGVLRKRVGELCPRFVQACSQLRMTRRARMQWRMKAPRTRPEDEGDGSSFMEKGDSRDRQRTPRRTGGKGHRSEGERDRGRERDRGDRRRRAPRREPGTAPPPAKVTTEQYVSKAGRYRDWEAPWKQDIWWQNESCTRGTASGSSWVPPQPPTAPPERGARRQPRDQMNIEDATSLWLQILGVRGPGDVMGPTALPSSSHADRVQVIRSFSPDEVNLMQLGLMRVMAMLFVETCQLLQTHPMMQGGMVAVRVDDEEKEKNGLGVMKTMMTARSTCRQVFPQGPPPLHVTPSREQWRLSM